MKWIKQGLIYNANGEFNWAQSHAMIPTPIVLNENTIRVYVTFCDKNGIGRVGFVDVDSFNPKIIKGISPNPVLDIGLPGTFDENGALVCSVLTLNKKKYLYYVGFELGTKIRYRLLTGLGINAENDNNSYYFRKVKQTPILERSSDELFFRCGPFCLFEDNIFKLWYVAGSSWLKINNKDMPVYTINYLESNNGINWGNKGHVCINIQNDNEHGFGRPYVVKDEGFYKMFYSIRIKELGYRLGYAESVDGKNWERKDNEIGIDVSTEGWDSKMVCYSAVIQVNGRTYMFYNGNDFGGTGFGFAELMI